HESRARCTTSRPGKLKEEGEMTMARKIYPYSLDRKDAKVAGVASTIGAMTGIDPTFIRIGFVAAAIFISFKLTLLAYAAIGIYLPVKKKNPATGNRQLSDSEGMGEWARRKPRVHAMVKNPDETDRRRMATNT